MKILPKILQAQSLVERLAGPAVRNLLLLAVRLVWGYSFFVAGRGKLGRIPDVTNFFASLGIPAPHLNALFVATLECVGGLLLIAGLFSRPIAFLLVGNMIVAYVTTEKEAFGPLFTDGNPGKFIAADPFWFLVAVLLVLSFGAGKFSLDAMVQWTLQRLLKREHPVQSPVLFTPDLAARSTSLAAGL